jgi:hypothetical protein
MLEKFNQLSIVIGVFFILVAVVLLGGYILTDSLHFTINLYTGVGLLVFGVFMLMVKEKTD